jgi:non-reducing end alpha-L-arabinofuranosidase
MKQQRVLGGLMVTFAVSCGGTTLQVDDEPNGTGGTKGGSKTESSGDGGGTDGGGTGGPAGPAAPPCDVLEADGHPCVAAHSTVRVLRSAYTGPLYQVCKGPVNAGPGACMGEALDIGAVRGGFADASAQDTFCGTMRCSITMVYDQSGQGNHLEPSPPGGAKPTPGDPVDAKALPTTIDGHDVYGMLFRDGMGYRTGCHTCSIPTGNGMAEGDEPETIYMVTSQHDLINGCCFDYGNAQRSSENDGNGTAEAVYFGSGVIWGTGHGEGPWVMADLENGLYAGWENQQDRNISTNTTLAHDFVTAVLVGDTADLNGGKGRFALYGGDAQSGALQTMYDGIRPEKPGYVPMMKQGSIVLSIAGDNSDQDGGRFYEGVIVSGAASKETVDALQAAIVAARYGR